MNGQSQPGRKAIKILTERLAAEEIRAGHLLELWDQAFVPIPRSRQPTAGSQPSETEQPQPFVQKLADISPAPIPHSSESAGEKLASLVAHECAAELNDRVLHGWEPLVVSWRPYTGQNGDPEAAGAVQAGDTENIEPLARYLRDGGRLIVCGPGGAGKSTLAILLIDELLANRKPGDRVPVLVCAASLAPGEMVTSWLERTLTERYPPLRDTRVYGANAAGGLVAQRCVLPVIDGLDELAPAADRGDTVSANGTARESPVQPAHGGTGPLHLRRSRGNGSCTGRSKRPGDDRKPDSARAGRCSVRLAGHERGHPSGAAVERSGSRVLAGLPRDAPDELPHDFIRFGLYGLGIGLTLWLALPLSHANDGKLYAVRT